MKNLIWISAISLFFSILLISCNPDEQQQTKVLTVETTIQEDRAYFDSLYNGLKHYHFETNIELQHYMDWDSINKIVCISNIFEVTNKPIKDQLETKVNVFAVRHYSLDSISMIEKPNAFWVSDQDLYKDNFKISFKEAYQILVRQNEYKIPHSVYCTLRRQVGPNKCNPQYIFGNKQYHLFVDSQTGEISNIDPSGLPEEKFNLE